ncbi:MAG: hypothetical protein ACPGU7_00445 [Gammaproteobacteria bacterium]
MPLSSASKTYVRSANRSRRGRSNSSRSRRLKELHKCRRGKLFLKLVILVMAVALVMMGGYTRMSTSGDDEALKETQGKLRRKDAEFAALETEMADLRKQMEAIVQGRVPGLNKIVYDRVIDVDDKYLKNVIFTVSRKGSETSYGFNISLHNRSPNVIEPKLDLYLFNDSGLQIGAASLKGLSDQVLIPDEQRSFNGQIELNLNGEPTYFMANVR